MKSSQLSTLSQEIGLRLKKNHTMDEALLRDLVSAIADLVVDMQEATEAYDTLSRDIEALFAYGDDAESPKFCAGAIWGMVSVRTAIVAKESEDVRQEELREAARRHYDLLVAINDNPGITQQDLAEKLHKKKSNLAQIIARLEPYRLFIVSPAGWYRKYRISSLGKSILSEMDAEQSQAPISRSLRHYHHIPRGMETMKVDAILAHNEHREAIIDVRESGYQVPVPRSSTQIGPQTSGLLSHDLAETEHVATLREARRASMPHSFTKSRFDAMTALSQTKK